MTYRHRICSFALALALLAAIGTVQAAPRVGDFALLDQHGDFYQLSYYKDAKAFALMVLPAGEDKALIDSYQQLAAKYRGQEFVFAGIRIGTVGDREVLKKRLLDAGVTLPVLLDESESVAEMLNLTRAGEVLLLDPAQKQTMFRGPVGPALALAIKQRAANETIAPARVEISGPSLPMSNARKNWRDPKSVSYTKDVAPLLVKNCLGCHRAAGIAPFAMDSWGVVLGWSPMIKEVLLTKRMPPGQLDPAIGDFKNGRALRSKDIATLVRWIDAGAVQDGNRDPLAELPVKRGNEWAFGEPDHIIEVPPQTVPALGPVDVARSVIPVGLQKDKWLRASQFMPGDERVLHHAELFLAPTRTPANPPVEQARFSVNALPPYYGGSDPSIAAFSPFVPGDEPLALPSNTGGVIAKDASLVVQLHYATIGREVSDKSRIGLWFHDDASPPKGRVTIECACIEPTRWKSIPPRVADFKVQATLTLAKDAFLYNVLPRMHFRGSAIRIDAVRPSGEVEPLLNVAKYSYNWQINYQFREPKLIPAGTKLIASARYDNSERNTFNPDLSQAVGWGLESFNEELAVVFQLKYVD